MKRFVCFVVLCLFCTSAFAADAKVAAKVDTNTAKVAAADETATQAKTVAVKEMPANANGETATRNVAVPEDVLGFRNAEKPTVKDKLPELPKPGFFARLAIGGILWIVFECLKFLALIAVVLWLLRHLWPKAAERAEATAAKIGAKTGTNIVGSVGEAVDKFDAIVSDLTEKHKEHSALAALANSRLSKIGAPAKKKKASNAN